MFKVPLRLAYQLSWKENTSLWGRRLKIFCLILLLIVGFRYKNSYLILPAKFIFNIFFLHVENYPFICSMELTILNNRPLQQHQPEKVERECIV